MSSNWQQCACGLLFQPPLPDGRCPNCGKTERPSLTQNPLPVRSPIAPLSRMQRWVLVGTAGFIILLLGIGIASVKSRRTLIADLASPRSGSSGKTPTEEKANPPIAKAPQEKKRDVSNARMPVEKKPDPANIKTYEDKEPSTTVNALRYPDKSPSVIINKILGREEFTGKVRGKTKAQVIAMLGRPAQTFTIDPWEYWAYKKRTKDVATGEVDGTAQLVFQDGEVVAVNFLPF